MIVLRKPHQPRKWSAVIYFAENDERTIPKKGANLGASSALAILELLDLMQIGSWDRGRRSRRV